MMRCGLQKRKTSHVGGDIELITAVTDEMEIFHHLAKFFGGGETLYSLIIFYNDPLVFRIPLNQLAKKGAKQSCIANAETGSSAKMLNLSDNNFSLLKYQTKDILKPHSNTCVLSSEKTTQSSP